MNKIIGIICLIAMSGYLVYSIYKLVATIIAKNKQKRNSNKTDTISK